MAKKWWANGVRFQCQGSGKCCLSRGEYGFVYLTLEDRRLLGSHLGLSTREFTDQYCDRTDGFFHLKDPDADSCLFLKGKKCGVYEARPTQCRTWPFWPDHMGAKTWARDVAAYCPGVGKGPIIEVHKIEEQLNQQQASSRKLQQEAAKAKL